MDFTLLGATIDDAAGEAFDKVAAMLGLPYPGGPSIQKAAEGGNPQAYTLPRSFRGEDDRLDFSFSGLKTAVRYRIAGPGRPDLSQIELAPQQVADLAASFQEAVVDVLLDKTFAALRRTGLRKLCVGGGVAANARFRCDCRKKRPRRRATSYCPLAALHRQRRDGRDRRRALQGRAVRGPQPGGLPRAGAEAEFHRAGAELSRPRSRLSQSILTRSVSEVTTWQLALRFGLVSVATANFSLLFEPGYHPCSTRRMMVS